MAATADISSATTLEGQVFEVLREIQQAEDVWIAAGLALDPPENRRRRLTLTPNPSTGVLNFSGTIPITTTDSADGMTFAAQEYIT